MPMLAGNPNAGKRVASILLGVALVMILITAVLAVRKRTAPAKTPPLHPSVVVAR